MDHLMLIVGPSALAWLFVNVLQFPRIIKRAMWGDDVRKWRQLKPIDCDLCLSFWFGIGQAIYFRTDPLISTYIGCAAAILTIFINKFLNK
ncbi:hypothetical protein CK934_28025 [Chitinophaga sp. MD30]|nr:hypothetical protein CK934_28025 [Chitinophaga sp. MD30]